MTTEHKPLPVLSYHAQHGITVKLVNSNKRFEEQTLKVLDVLARCPDVDQYWLAIGRTHIKQGWMAINWALLKPTRVHSTEEDGA